MTEAIPITKIIVIIIIFIIGKNQRGNKIR